MLRIVVEQSMDSAVLRCSGRLVAGEEVLRLREAVMCLADKRRVQVDLAGVEAIDAAGLGLLVSLHALGHVVGFKLQVRNPVRRVRELLKMTRLESVLDIPPSDETEVQSSAGDSSSDGHFGGALKSPTYIKDRPFARPESHSPRSAPLLRC